MCVMCTMWYLRSVLYSSCLPCLFILSSFMNIMRQNPFWCALYTHLIVIIALVLPPPPPLLLLVVQVNLQVVFVCRMIQYNRVYVCLHMYKNTIIFKYQNYKHNTYMHLKKFLSLSSGVENLCSTTDMCINIKISWYSTLQKIWESRSHLSASSWFPLKKANITKTTLCTRFFRLRVKKGIVVLCMNWTDSVVDYAMQYKDEILFQLNYFWFSVKLCCLTSIKIRKSMWKEGYYIICLLIFAC